MNWKRAIAAIVVLLCLYPFLGIAWVAGVIWSALEAGFWHGQRYVDGLSDGFKTFSYRVDSDQP